MATASQASAEGQAGGASAPGMVQVPFSDLPGWEVDDHARAFHAFRVSCERIQQRASAGQGTHALASICKRALARGDRRLSQREAKVFFEHFFRAHCAGPASEAAGLLTGYYEPIIEGSRTRTGTFTVPVYRRPPELVNVVEDSERARPDVPFTHMRRTASGLQPFATRAEIEAGALSGRGLELMWLADPVDAFFAQVQGSLRVRLPDGSLAALTYDGKNGHPYSSIGRLLIDQGAISAGEMTLDRLGAWLRADAECAKAVMRHNASFVFFREVEGPLSCHAQGALETALVPGRSLAVDTRYHALGLPIYVDAPELRHWGRRAPFRRLMVAHDVGSAIRGRERGDIYFGSGALAGERAGRTKHRARFFVLLPREDLA